ncbi:MAG: sulfatase-like hydrolase/transferase, partial [Pseudomonadota bacterium]|nr:sulfatase-like hydrolase/transferase [Pseudomonadota bacterium]
MLRSLSIFVLLTLSSAAFAQPNIVFIFADDLGVGDVGAYGGKTINTPNIDALAANGVLFEQAYATHPVCS